MPSNILNDTETYNSIMLNLLRLMAEYDTTLVQYNQATLDYTNYVKNNGTTLNELTQIAGKNYWGKSQVTSQASYPVNSSNVCQALCSSTTGCFAATYKAPSSQNANAQCYLVSGITNLIAGSPGDYAIVPQIITYLTNMDTLNSQLLSINQQIMDILTNPTTNLSTLLPSQYNANEETLKTEFDSLKEQKTAIKEQIDKYAELNTEQNEWNIYLNKYYYLYFVFLVILIVVIISFIKISYSTSVTSSSPFQESQIGSIIFYIILALVALILFLYIRNKM